MESYLASVKPSEARRPATSSDSHDKDLTHVLNSIKDTTKFWHR